jgi:tetratricopeptide (TPR) repeat protein
MIAASRRILVVATALLVSVPILRPALSSALVTRGDALLYARDVRAREKYSLALRIDPGNTVAADRYVFAAFLSRKPQELEDAVRVASVVLKTYPHEASVRMDRALCLQLRKQYRMAAQDFEEVGRERADVQALALAASDERMGGDMLAARRLLFAAAHIDPKYMPVRIALERSRE